MATLTMGNIEEKNEEFQLMSMIWKEVSKKKLPN
jgi:hypothetical protein